MAEFTTISNDDPKTSAIVVNGNYYINMLQNTNDDDSSLSNEEDKDDLNDEYFETLDIDKLNLKNTDKTKSESPRDVETAIQTETKLTNLIDYNHYPTSIVDTSCTNYDQNIDLKDLLSHRDNDYFVNNDDDTSNDSPSVNKFIQEAIAFGANALDLSKKSLPAIPKLLFKLDCLQV